MEIFGNKLNKLIIQLQHLEDFLHCYAANLYFQLFIIPYLFL